MMRANQKYLPERRLLGHPLLVWAMLLMTIILSLLWSHVRLMWVDEFLAFYTGGVPTFRDVLRVQLNYPLGLEPPLYHLVSHAMMNVLGHYPMVLRLPALLGFLLFQASIFAFVNKLAGERSALVAMAFPFITSTVYRSVDARPYGILMGLFALALACWQAAARSEDAGEPRLPALLGLWLAFTLAFITHYFGVLVVVPVLLAEATRILRRRHLDRGMIVTLLLGCSSVILILPFLKGTKIYRAHYYLQQKINLRFLAETYRRVLFDDHTPLNHAGQMLLLVVMLLAIAASVALGLRKGRDYGPAEDWVGLAAMALIPFCGVILDLLVTRTLVYRYLLPTAFAFAASAGIILQAPLRKSAVFYAVMVATLATGLWLNLCNIQMDRKFTSNVLASCTPSPAVQAALARAPQERIYVQTFSQYLIYSYYAPDPAIRARLTLLTDKEQLKWENLDNIYRMTENLRHFGPIPVVPYQDFLTLHQPLLLYYLKADDGDVWIDKDLKEKGRDLKNFGPWMHGYLAEVGDANNGSPKAMP